MVALDFPPLILQPLSQQRHSFGLHRRGADLDVVLDLLPRGFGGVLHAQTDVDVDVVGRSLHLPPRLGHSCYNIYC